MLKDHPKDRSTLVFKPSVQSVSLLIWLVLPPAAFVHLLSGLASYFWTIALHLVCWTRILAVSSSRIVEIALVSRHHCRDRWCGSFRYHVGSTMSIVRTDTPTGRVQLLILTSASPPQLVAVITQGAFGHTELETARYYFKPRHLVIPWTEPPADLMNHQGPVWVSISVQDGHPMVKLPAVLTTGKLVQEVVDFSRLRLMRVDFHQTSAAGE